MVHRNTGLQGLGTGMTEITAYRAANSNSWGDFAGDHRHGEVPGRDGCHHPHRLLDDYRATGG